KSVFLLSALVDFYWRAGDSLMAFRIFDAMEDRNEVSWTTMIVGYVGISCVQLGTISLGKVIHGYSLRHGLKSDAALCISKFQTSKYLKSYLRWERNGKPTYPEQEKEEFEEARKELQRELEKGTSLDYLRKKMTKGEIQTEE
ncbi:pentatricopeptide repeat-containing protein, partial [Tanacetum coccineum]